MRKILFGALALLPLALGFAPAAQAEPRIKVPPGAKLMVCTFNPSARSGIVPNEVVILQEKGGRVTAYDPVIDFYIGQPVGARVQVDNDRRTTWAWDLKKLQSKSSGDYAPSVAVRLTMQKADLRASISVKPQGYLDERAQGKCVQR